MITENSSSAVFRLMILCDPLVSPISYSRPLATLQTNTNYAPTLQILNSKNKTMRISREGVPDGVIVNPGATAQLRHDDRVDIVSGLPLTYVHYIRHTPSFLSTQSFDYRSAASSGRVYAASKRPEKSERRFP
jgi:hypothetical protein